MDLKNLASIDIIKYFIFFAWDQNRIIRNCLCYSAWWLEWLEYLVTLWQNLWWGFEQTHSVLYESTSVFWRERMWP